MMTPIADAMSDRGVASGVMVRCGRTLSMTSLTICVRDRLVQVVLVAEVAVQDAAADAGLGRDLLGARAGPVLVDGGDAGRDEGGAPRARCSVQREPAAVGDRLTGGAWAAERPGRASDRRNAHRPPPLVVADRSRSQRRPAEPSRVRPADLL